MAKLVAVLRDVGTGFLGKRQLPLVVEENLEFVMELGGKAVIDLDETMVPDKELDKFLTLYESLSENEAVGALQLDLKELSQALQQTVACIGCRRSVQQLYRRLTSKGLVTLDPLSFKPDGILTIAPDYFLSPKLICSLFYTYKNCGVGTEGELCRGLVSAWTVEEGRRRGGRKRCPLHSLESGRSGRLLPSWRSLWDSMKPCVRDRVVVIDSLILLGTLENYLTKHRFCGECRTKVDKAYWLLVGEESGREKGYMPKLYSGIKRCVASSHIHLPTSTEYISALIARAQPAVIPPSSAAATLTGVERHARTLEVAQGEVITCLGLCLYERLHRIQVMLREEETACHILALVTLDALYSKFKMAVEKKRGISTLEILCNELKQEEILKQHKREQKKLKRKKRKEKKAFLELQLSNQLSDSIAEEADKEVWITDESPCRECEEDTDCLDNQTDPTRLSLDFHFTEQEASCLPVIDDKEEVGSSSESDCNYRGEDDNFGSTPSKSSSASGLSERSRISIEEAMDRSKSAVSQVGTNKTLSLQQMLEECCSSSDESGESYIPQEDVEKFHSRGTNIARQREELRRTLRLKFEELCRTTSSLGPIGPRTNLLLATAPP